MIPAKEDKRWEDLVTGKINHHFKCIPAALMLSQITRKVKNNSSQYIIQKSIDDIHYFFDKFESILKEDINEIFKEGA